MLLSIIDSTTGDMTSTVIQKSPLCPSLDCPLPEEISKNFFVLDKNQKRKCIDIYMYKSKCQENASSVAGSRRGFVLLVRDVLNVEMCDESEAELQCRSEISDDPFGLGFDRIAREHILDVVEEVTDAIHVLHVLGSLVDIFEHLVQLHRDLRLRSNLKHLSE